MTQVENYKINNQETLKSVFMEFRAGRRLQLNYWG